MNEIEPVAIVTVLLPVKPWPLMNKTRSPVTGSYDALDGVNGPLAPPVTETAFVTALANTCS